LLEPRSVWSYHPSRIVEHGRLRRSEPMIQGIDVHGEKGAVDWERVRGFGISFAWVKASEGRTFDDDRFVQNRQAAKAAGIRVGAYHYARPDNNAPREEAEHFLHVARPVAGELLPALDYEAPRARALAPSTLVRWASEWLEIVEAAIGASPIFYSFPSYISSEMGGGGLALGQNPLWLASFGPNDGDVHSVSPVGVFPQIAVHQFTSKGRVPGVRGNCDRDVLLAANLDTITYRGPASKVKFELWDDERKLAESQPVAAGGTAETDRYRRFVVHRAALALRQLRGEKAVGTVSIKRRPT
jgi:lysozyme